MLFWPNDRSSSQLPLLSVASCTVDESPETGGAGTCQGKCDAPSTPVVTCVAFKDTQADQFFRTDHLDCTYDSTSASALPIAGAIIEVQTANGRHQSFRWTEAGATSLPLGNADAYPFTVDMTILVGQSDRPGLKNLGPFQIEQQVVIATPEAATPALFVLPFDVWSVKIGSRTDETTSLGLRHEIAAEPRAINVQETIILNHGIREDVAVLVPHGATTQKVSLGLTTSTEATLTGPGRYDVTVAGELVRIDTSSAPSDGLITATCLRAPQQLGTTFSTNIKCSPIADAEVVSISVTITPNEGADPVTRTLTGPETIKFDGTVDATVTVEATLLETVTGMSGLDGSSVLDLHASGRDNDRRLHSSPV